MVPIPGTKRIASLEPSGPHSSGSSPRAGTAARTLGARAGLCRRAPPAAAPSSAVLRGGCAGDADGGRRARDLHERAVTADAVPVTRPPVVPCRGSRRIGSDELEEARRASRGLPHCRRMRESALVRRRSRSSSDAGVSSTALRLLLFTHEAAVCGDRLRLCEKRDVCARGRGRRVRGVPARLGKCAQLLNTVAQSFLMLTTVQPCSAAVSSELSAPAV